MSAARPPVVGSAQQALHEAVAATRESLRMAEAEYSRLALARHRAAAQFGLAKNALYEKLCRYDLLGAVSDVRGRGAHRH